MLGIGTCTATVDQLSPGEIAWTDTNDNVQVGDEIQPGEILHIGDCKEW